MEYFLALMWMKYKKFALILTVVFLLLAAGILLYPQKIGDVSGDGQSVYWRYSDPSLPGEWLPKATEDDQQGKVVDWMGIGSNRVAVLFENKTVSIVSRDEFTRKHLK